MTEILRAAAYCRVSTEKEDQRNSLEAQRAFFQSYLRGQPGWELVQIFADEGLSGTSIAHRPQFGRMLDMALAGELDLIVTKEVSRFARNTVDALNVTRQLKTHGVGVLFLNDGIDTRDSDGEFRLTIMASVAQEESRKISQRTRWGQARAMERGVVFGNNTLYGYTLRKGVLTVRQEQAEVVRRIFEKFLQEGKGAAVIARELTEEGVAPPLRLDGAWSSATVLRILRNEKYCGSLLQHKYRTADYLSHRRLPNDGTEPQAFFPAHHEAIVSPELYQKAREELARRRKLSEDGKRHSARYWYSGRVFCGDCGKTMTPKRTRRPGGREYLCFVCRGRAGKAESRCTMRGVSGAVIEAAARHVVEGLGLNRERIIGAVLAEMEREKAPWKQGEQRRQQALRVQTSRRERALNAYLDGTISREEWREISAKCEAALERLFAQNGKEKRGENASENRAETLQSKMEKMLKTENWMLEECIEKITVERDKLMIHLWGCSTFFLVRAGGVGSGRGYRVEVSECAPIVENF